jgi:Saccharopine dehydrogenase NADP binding domain
MRELRVLVLGGYGLFGRHVCLQLQRIQLAEKARPLQVFIGGRDLSKASKLAGVLNENEGSHKSHRPGDTANKSHRPGDTANNPRIQFHPCALDCTKGLELTQQLHALNIDCIVHCAGPFQHADYTVAKAAIESETHYVDLADAREFVCGIGILNQAALDAGVCVISGASSVPALSSAVIRELTQDINEVYAADIAISPGNRTERGLATVRAILSYSGEAIPGFHNGQVIRRFGWMRPRRMHSKRWLVDCDVPDMQLLPQLDPRIRSLSFGAGLEFLPMHFGLYLLAALRRLRLLPNLSRFDHLLLRMSQWFEGFGSDCGLMKVEIRGANQGSKLHRQWSLQAYEGAGPFVPATAAAAFVARLASDAMIEPGARTAAFEFTLEELLTLWQGLPIYTDIS